MHILEADGLEKKLNLRLSKASPLSLDVWSYFVVTQWAWWPSNMDNPQDVLCELHDDSESYSWLC